MHTRIILTCLLLLTILTTRSQTNKSFSLLNKVVVDTNFNHVVFGYDSKTTRLIRKKCTDLPKTDYWYCAPDEFGETLEKIGLFANDRVRDTLECIYSPGLSADPVFIVYNRKKKKVIGSVDATEFYVNNLGIVYTAGHTNNMFNVRRKFVLTQDTLLEVKQPYYYVGLKSKTTAPITIYQNKTDNNILLQLPVGYEVEVLLCDRGNDDSEKYYLIRTDFGIVGWLRLTSDATYEAPIEGLFFAGD